MRCPSPPLPPVTRATAPVRSISFLPHGGAARPASTYPKPVEPRRGAGEQVGLFRRRGAAREPLEGIEQHRIAARPLVDREVAFEHAAAGAEALDAGLDIGPPGTSQLSR